MGENDYEAYGMTMSPKPSSVNPRAPENTSDLGHRIFMGRSKEVATETI